MFWHVVKRFVHRSPGLGCWRPTAQRPGCNSGAGRCLCQLGPKGSNPDHQPLESWQVHLTTLKVTGKFLPRKGSPVPMVSAPRSSELSKLVANAMLAQRVSSINSISRRSAVGKWTPMVHLGYRKTNQIGCSNMLCINRYRGDQYVYYVWGFHTCLNRSRWLCWHSCPWLWSEALLGMGKWAWTEDDKSRRSNMYRCRLYESPRYWMVESWASANFQTTFSGPRISGMNSPDVKSLQLLVGLRLFDLIAF